MLRGEGEGARRKEQNLVDLRRINNAGQHLLGLIADVLDISEIEVGHFELHEEPVDLAKLVDDCHRAALERAKAAGLDLRAEPVAGLPMLLADERRFEQIVLNLLTNPGKFTPPGGPIVPSPPSPAAGGVALFFPPPRLRLTPPGDPAPPPASPP